MVKQQGLFENTSVKSQCVFFSYIAVGIEVVFTYFIMKGLPELDDNNNRSLFAMIMVLRNLYIDSEKWNKEIYTPLVSLVNEYKEVIRFSCIGFPEGWEWKLRK